MKAWGLAMGLVAWCAQAQQSEKLPSFSLTRFHLSDGARGALTAASGDTLAAHRFRAGVLLHYENSPLSYYRDSTRVGALVANRAQVHLGLSFGITSWLQASAEVSMVVAQFGDDLSREARVASPDRFGVGSPRASLRLGVLSQSQGGLVPEAGFDLAIQMGLAFPFGTGSALNIESGWTPVPQLSFGRNFGAVRIGGEVSAIFRPSTALTPSSPRDTVGHQFGIRTVVASRGEGVRF
jgi:hypothetical protein